MQALGPITYVKTIGERIQAIRKKKGLSQAALAKAAGVATSTIGNLESGLRDKPREILALARALDVDAQWLETGRESLDSDRQPEYAGRPRRSRRIPIVGTARMGDDGFYDEISAATGQGDGHIEIASEDPNAYGLRVKGQSMFPAIRDGWYVLVEPNLPVRQGEYVLIKLRDGRKMVKELLFQKSTSIEVLSVNGDLRMTFDVSELDEHRGLQAVGAVLSPSKWRPD